MDREELKDKIDFDNIQEFITKDNIKIDYLMDSEGNHIIPLTPLNMKLIEKIKELEVRLKRLEDTKS